MIRRVMLNSAPLKPVPLKTAPLDSGLLMSALLLSASSVFLPGASAETLSADFAKQLRDQVSSALVKVSITMHYDGSDVPSMQGGMKKCPNCGKFHPFDAGEEVVSDRRPMQMGGFLVSDTLVVVRDPLLQRRFIRSVSVQHGSSSVEAEFQAFLQNDGAALLKLERPLEGAVPLDFAATDEEPKVALGFGLFNGSWTVSVKPIGTMFAFKEGIEPVRTVQPGALLMGAKGNCLGITMDGELDTDENWRGSPAQRETLDRAGVDAMLARVKSLANQCVLDVTLHFRPPKREKGNQSFDMYGGFYGGYGEEESVSVTEQKAIAVAIGANQLLVSAAMDYDTTARLERVEIHMPDGKSVDARFVQSLREFSAFVAEVDVTLPLAVKPPRQELIAWNGKLLVAADIAPVDRRKIRKFWPTRVSSFDIGYRGALFPQISYGDDTQFLFDADGNLLCLPIGKRQLPNMGYEYWNEYLEPPVVPWSLIHEQVSDLDTYGDADNAPLAKEEEGRLPWLGIELQSLDPALARAYGVMKETDDGSMGALVSHVYPDSPAQRQGVKSGWLILRLRSEHFPQPINVQLDSMSMDMAFPWDQLDQLPEQYFSEIPAPWPSVKNPVNRTIRMFGFGETFTADFFDRKELRTLEFEVEKSPDHFLVAPRFRSEPLGMAVKKITYEVRQYLQMKNDDPGVVISSIDSGSRAAVAGLKPYEIITHVNGQAVSDVDAFEKALSEEAEVLNLSVKRMARARNVRIRLN